MFGRNKKTDASVNAPKQEAPVVRMALEEFFAKTPDVPDPFQGVPTPPPEPQPEPEPVTPVSLLADY